MEPLNVSQDMSILSLVTNASVLVQIVLALLLLVSVMSWTYIFRKYFDVKVAQRQTTRFEEDFWSGGDLNDLYARVNNRREQAGALGRVFEAGMREFLKYRQQKSDSGQQLDAARRAMRAAFQREMDVLEAHLSFLASVGSVSPNVGLFGTVWGIMNAFRSLANVQAATLAHVAPGIAEALVATAIGLFAAIPAVIAYNRFSHGINRIEARLNRFADGFHATLSRQLESEGRR